MRDLAGAIIAARRAGDALTRESGARMAHGDPWMIDGFAREADAQFALLATALGYLVTRDDPHPADGADTAATAPAN